MNISEMAHTLKLPYIRQNYKMLIEEANHTKMNYKEFLESFLEREVILRRENSVKNRLRAAKFPIKKYLEDFDRNKYANEFRNKFEELDTLEFIKNKENVILIGSPGCGNYEKFLVMERNKRILSIYKNYTFISSHNTPK